MAKIKILFLITKDDVGGAQKYVKELAENIDPQKFRPVIASGRVSTRFINESANFSSHKIKTLKFLSNSFRPHFLFLNDILALFEVFFLLCRERPDILHLNSSKAGVIGSFAAALFNLFKAGNKKIKVIFTAHGWVFNPDNAVSPARRWFYRLLHKTAGRFQHAIINVSEYDRSLALRYNIAPKNKLHLIHNGIIAPNFLSKADARKFLLRMLKVDNKKNLVEAVWVGSIGRLVKEKDYATLIYAARLVKNAHFFIIGDGYESEKLKFIIKNQGLVDRVFLLGSIVPAAQHLKAFDIFALSSVKEGLPYTVLEAMAAKLPVVATRVGGVTELLEGRGIVMPPRQPHELARAINYCIQHPAEAQQYAEKAYQFFKERLQLNRMIKETERIYDRLF